MNYDFKQRDKIENSILGCIISDIRNPVFEGNPKALFEKHYFLEPTYFRTKFNQDLFGTFLTLWDKQIEIDLTTVCSYCPPEYKIGNSFNSFQMNCITLTQNISSAYHIENYIMLLKQYVLMDFWNKKSSEILDNYWDERDVIDVGKNIVDAYTMLYSEFNKIGSNSTGLQSKKEQLLSKHQKVQNGEVITVPIPIFDIQIATGGWQPSELTIIGARPGMGKTTVALILAKYASFDYKVPGIFISLEMSKYSLMNRIISEQTGLDYNDIKNLKITKEELNLVIQWYDYFENTSDLKIFDVNDCRTLTDIVSKIDLLKPKFVFIDYLQLIKLDKTINKNGNREQEVGEISRNLKLAALTYDIPIIALSQLSRKCEDRPGKKPMLSDLRESGSLEQDADNVSFFFREAYYKEKEGQTVPSIEKGNLLWIWAKGRETVTDNYECNVNFTKYTITNGFLYHGIDDQDEILNLPPPPPKT
jgi:replicative DNA helicase